jgi:uncharacterized membrane protein YidH (DUF202 family)
MTSLGLLILGIALSTATLGCALWLRALSRKYDRQELGRAAAVAAFCDLVILVAILIALLPHFLDA